MQLFVEVDDVAATAGRAQELGGQLIIPPQKLPGGDEMAIIQDPEGKPAYPLTSASTWARAEAARPSRS